MRDVGHVVDIAAFEQAQDRAVGQYRHVAIAGRARLQNAGATRKASKRAAKLMAQELGWDKDRRKREVKAFRALIDADLAAAGLTATADETDDSEDL